MIKNFYNQYVNREERVIFSLLLLVTAITAIYFIINGVKFHYTGNAYAPAILLTLMPLLLIMVVVGLYFAKEQPKMAQIARGLGLTFICLPLGGFLTTGVQYTPFSPVDSYLAHMDQLLHIDTIALLDWTYTKPWLVQILSHCYFGLDCELFIVPLLLVLLMRKKAFDIYMVASLISAIIGTAFYYFFPALAPAGFFHDIHFTMAQHATALKFYEVHHHLPLTTMAGGLIACPSFHVIWATLAAYAFKDEKKCVAVLITIFNLIVIFSTVLLGWHYAIDVVGGLLVASFSIWFAKRLCFSNADKPIFIPKYRAGHLSATNAILR